MSHDENLMAREITRARGLRDHYVWEGSGLQSLAYPEDAPHACMRGDVGVASLMPQRWTRLTGSNVQKSASIASAPTPHGYNEGHYHCSTGPLSARLPSVAHLVATRVCPDGMKFHPSMPQATEMRLHRSYLNRTFSNIPAELHLRERCSDIFHILVFPPLQLTTSKLVTVRSAGPPLGFAQYWTQVDSGSERRKIVSAEHFVKPQGDAATLSIREVDALLPITVSLHRGISYGDVDLRLKNDDGTFRLETPVIRSARDINPGNASFATGIPLLQPASCLCHMLYCNSNLRRL